jgi:hypothetical protein
LLAGAWRGTRFAVALAADFLTAQKRIERIETLKAEVGSMERSYTDKDNIVVEGRIRTENGAPLPKGLVLSLHVASAQVSMGIGGVPLTNGQFRWAGKFGDIHLAAWNAKGYGPSFAGPLRTEPGGAITNVELVLRKGYTSAIKVTDDKGNPLPGVKLEGFYQQPNGSVPVQASTDQNGTANIEHVVDAAMRWTANVPGYQPVEREQLRLAADGQLLLEMKPARVTTGKIVDKKDGKPVAGARFKLLYRSGGSVRPDVENIPDLAITDQEGAFRIDSFADGFQHLIAVQAAGYATKIVRNVEAGQSGIEVQLGPDLFITGRIEGDLSKLARMPDPVIYVASPIRLSENNSTHFNRNVPVLLTNGVATFAVSNLWEGELTIDAGGKQIEYLLHEPKTNIVIELPKKGGVPPFRPIVVRLIPPANTPPVKGQLKVTRASLEDSAYHSEYIPLQNNEARFEAPVGTWVSWETRAIVGYWTPDAHHTVIDGAGPQLIEAPALPAGAIHGRVRNADGAEAAGVMISVIEAKPAPGKQAGSLGDVGKNHSSSGEGPTRFVAQPLPIGGKYVLVAHRGNQFVVSEPIVISEEEPIRELELRLVDGETLSGVVSDSSGNPLANVPVSLNYRTPYGHSFGIVGFGSPGGPKTDSQGRFSIPNLNKTVPGAYEIVIDRVNGYQTASVSALFDRSVKIALQRGEKFSGIVLNELTGEPLMGVHFYMLVTDFRVGGIHNMVEADAASNAEGRFEFTRVPAGDYNLFSRDGEIVSDSKALKVPSPGTQPFQVRLKPHSGARLWEKGKLVSGQP